jgi:formate hydrogenlyase subunit 3/multisubunit Na+/H+ antiporter MnhD subunit
MLKWINLLFLYVFMLFIVCYIMYSISDKDKNIKNHKWTFAFQQLFFGTLFVSLEQQMKIPTLGKRKEFC